MAMIAKSKQVIFYDVDTQNDFLNENGALYVKQSNLIKPNLKLLTEFAIKKHYNIIGSVDKHHYLEEFKGSQYELIKNGGTFENHCMVGTYGQEKIIETKTTIRTFYANYVGEYVNKELIDVCFQRKIPLFFEKQTYNVFQNNGAKYFFEEYLNPEETIIVIYGVATDWCVRAVVENLLKLNYKIAIVNDAIEGIDYKEVDKLLKEWSKNENIKLMKTEEIINKLIL